MTHIKRLPQLSLKTSTMVLGPRQSGKSTWIKEQLENQKYHTFDLLNISLYRKFLKNPELFSQEIESQIKLKAIIFFFVDEFQKIPELTNAVHDLIEKHKIYFILSGSSARKLKRGNTNLLGGRAIMQSLFPFTTLELGSYFDLEKVLKYGALPGIYFDDEELAQDKLTAYVNTYLKEEIAQEGLVRSFEAFNRFLDIAGIYAAEILSFANISREASVPEKSVKNYFNILNETLIGFFLPAWDDSLKRQLSLHSKFYFVDNGITSAICQRLRDPLDLLVRGKMFEQWCINEIRALIHYQKKEYNLHYWRTARGEYEVDLLLVKQGKIRLAIEFKCKKVINKRDIVGLKEISSDNPKIKLLCICLAENPYELEGVQVINAKEIFSDISLMNKLLWV
jgi:predicted AAA+ superfamily ATPase